MLQSNCFEFTKLMLNFFFFGQVQQLFRPTDKFFNSLVHNEVHPVLAQSLQHILIAVKHHNLAWPDAKSSSLWSPPLPGNIKANFDVVVKPDFVVAAMVLSDSNGNIIQVIIKRLSTIDVAIGIAQAALLVIHSISNFFWGVLSYSRRGCNQHHLNYSKSKSLQGLELCFHYFGYQLFFTVFSQLES